MLAEDVYVFDTYTSRALLACLPSVENAAIQAYVYVREHSWQLNPSRHHQHVVDWVSIVLSLFKLTECYIFWSFNSKLLAIVTGMNWAFFFLSAILLQTFGVSREDLHFDQDTTYVDIITGQLPTTQVPGKNGKILLGMPQNPRKGWVWRFVWALGSLVSATSLVSMYILLGKQSQNQVYIWGGFQLLWLACRSGFFHFATETDGLIQMVSKVTKSQRPPNYKARVLALAVAVSKHQILVHPRSSLKGTWCYDEDIQTMSKIEEIFDNAKWEVQSYTLEQSTLDIGASVEIEILGIISDTILSSIAWMQGSKLTPMDLYDSIILQIRVGSVIRLVPGTRALGRVAESDPTPLSDVEAPVVPGKPKRGSRNDGTYVSWSLWIPLMQNRWAHFSTPAEDIKLLGKRTVTAMSGVQVTDKLMKCDLGISLMSVDDVDDVIQRGMSASEILCRLLDPRVSNHIDRMISS